jgi:hypothetical protein
MQSDEKRKKLPEQITEQKLPEMKTHKGKETLHKSGEIKYKMYSKWDVGKAF